MKTARKRLLGLESLEARRLLSVTHRPIEEFVDAQGNFCLVAADPCPDDGKFVPPVDNFLGWFDPTHSFVLAMDYAGLADEWIQEESEGTVSFDTAFAGSVKERVLKDGTTEITVVLHTTNALTWAADISTVPDPGDQNAFLDAELVFGHRAPEILTGGVEAALGSSTLKATFITNQPPGSELPDLLSALFGTLDGVQVTRISLVAHAFGALHEQFGVPEGTPGHLQVTQIGLLDKFGKNGAVGDGFPAEHIKISALDDDNALRVAAIPQDIAAAPQMTDVRLEQAVQSAITFWSADLRVDAGHEIPQLHQVDVRLTNLPGTLLGYAGHDALWIDRDAAGLGWAAMDGAVDLITVVTHELGHMLGFDHDDAGLMAATLAPTERSPSIGTILAIAVPSLPSATQPREEVFREWENSEAVAVIDRVQAGDHRLATPLTEGAKVRQDRKHTGRRKSAELDLSELGTELEESRSTNAPPTGN